MTTLYRFTDWHNETNDEFFDTLEEAKKVFDEAVKDDPRGRFSIYEVTEHSDGNFEEYGIVFNENCPEYEV